MKEPAFLEYLKAQPDYRGQVVHIEAIPPRIAQLKALAKPLPAILEDCLRRRHLFPLYTHQAEAIDLARMGKNVMVATRSASGKTICYNVPVLETMQADPAATALYLFPTKALAQDQFRSLRELACPALLGLDQFATFDGDTPTRERSQIRKYGRLILTNPDMLHIGILPNHQLWSRFLRHLKFIVLDEAHGYRGVFGSHVAGVMRRLRRLCEYYGSSAQFVGCSATIANPGEHIKKLVGLPFEVVTTDGSPSGGKDFVFWNPPMVDKAKGTRSSTNSEAANLFVELVRQEKRTITFARSRRLTEVLYRYARELLAKTSPGLETRIMPYRAGYLPEERRRIERALFDGELTGVVATNALELGVNIGDLEATVLTGYPGSIASTWQQAGRSGRGRARSMSFLIGLDNPLDQYIMNHPEFFFGKSFENALVNPENPYIFKAHLVCAAWEKPLDGEDEKYFGPEMPIKIAELAEAGLLRAKRHRWYPATTVFQPAGSINIRAASNEQYRLINAADDSLLETIEASVAFFQIHPGAIYLHQGDAYLIKELDLVNRTALAVPSDATYHTQTKELEDLRIKRVLRQKTVGPVEVFVGEVAVTNQVLGYKKMAPFTNQVIGEEPLALPPTHFETVGLWFGLPEKTLADMQKSEMDIAGGLHAAEHAAISILPLFALCDRNDIGGISTPLHPDTGKAQIFIYDAYPGGIGIAEKGYEVISEIWQATLNAINDCPCESGCPACIQSPKCGNNNMPLDKEAAISLLEGLIGK
ncbi:MAG: DEAD/DEAH box helicase [Dehalococcoidia bacterium]|nr:MAG: DEAD/DEAH box helicase [Dehalococcoidia bacterium]